MRITTERIIAGCFAVSGLARGTVWLLDRLLAKEAAEREANRALLTAERENFLHLLDKPLYDSPA